MLRPSARSALLSTCASAPLPRPSAASPARSPLLGGRSAVAPLLLDPSLLGARVALASPLLDPWLAEEWAAATPAALAGTSTKPSGGREHAGSISRKCRPRVSVTPQNSKRFGTCAPSSHGWRLHASFSTGRKGFSRLPRARASYATAFELMQAQSTMYSCDTGHKASAPTRNGAQTPLGEKVWRSHS